MNARPSVPRASIAVVLAIACAGHAPAVPALPPPTDVPSLVEVGVPVVSAGDSLDAAETLLAGHVLDRATARGVDGVTVVLPSQGRGVQTAVDGQFALRVAATGDTASIWIRRIGYTPGHGVVLLRPRSRVEVEARLGAAAAVINCLQIVPDSTRRSRPPNPKR